MTTTQISLTSVLSPDIIGCDPCLDRLRERLGTLQGVSDVQISRAQARATIAYDPAVTTEPLVEDVIRREGAAIGEHYAHETLSIGGMDCADCASTLERGVSRLQGVEWATVNFAGARMNLEYASAETNLPKIERLVNSLGYRIERPSDARTEAPKSGIASIVGDRENLLLIVGIVLTVFGIAAETAGAASWLTIGLYAAAALTAGIPVARKGVATIRATHRLDINILMTIAVVGAFAIGEWLEAATVVVLFSLGEALERFTMDRARRSIGSLMSLAPTEALVRRPDGERMVAVSEIVPGDVLIVRPGDRLPVDGVIMSGYSVVNQAPVTGESIPVEKGPDADVFAGTINGEGVLEVRTSRIASDSTIARIILMVEDAQGQKAPTQRFIDVFAMYYTPAVVAIAAILAVAPPLLLDASWSTWVYRALVLLVIACPCALVISTPVSIVAAISAAAKNGVLIKGGAYLEAAGSLRALAFDKTGTLTLGKPDVSAIVPLDSMSETDLLTLAAAVEQYSEHPLGESIVSEACDRGLDFRSISVDNVRAHIGRGIEATVNGELVRVGTRALILNGSADALAEEKLLELEQAGQTAVLVQRGNTVLGIIGLADQVRPESRTAVKALKAAGIRETYMLTGDRLVVAEAIAATTGVDAVRAELMPEQKVMAIEELLQKHGKVGMVGDGINDGPALARSTVGIAMGAAGTPTALETADIALMSDDLSKVAFTIRLSRAAKRIIFQNIAFALTIKLVFLVLAVEGTATLWEAIIADVGASLVVIANGMRLLRQRDE